jgi:hypothetical protein
VSQQPRRLAQALARGGQQVQGCEGLQLQQFVEVSAIHLERVQVFEHDSRRGSLSPVYWYFRSNAA